jgi:hypothetical protein
VRCSAEPENPQWVEFESPLPVAPLPVERPEPQDEKFHPETENCLRLGAFAHGECQVQGDKYHA